MKRKLRLLLAMVLAMTMVMGMCVNAYAYEKTINPETGEGAPVDTGIIDVTEDSGCMIDYEPGEAQPYECMYIDDVERIPLTQSAACGATGIANLATLNMIAGTLFGMYGITDEVMPKLRIVCKFIPDGKIVQVYYYMYSVSYYEEHYGNTGLGLSDEIEYIDYDTFKSEAPSKTVIVADSVGATSFFDMKVHAADEKTNTNQKFLVQNLVGPKAKVLVTENIYPRRDLGTAENGATKILTWNNLPKNQAGPVFAVVYNEKDGAYVLNGVLDANGTAVFNGFKFRDASSVTICK